MKDAVRMMVTRIVRLNCVPISHRLVCDARRGVTSMPMVNLNRMIVGAVIMMRDRLMNEVENVVQMLRNLESRPSRLMAEIKMDSVLDVGQHLGIVIRHLESFVRQRMDAFRGNYFLMPPN